MTDIPDTAAEAEAAECYIVECADYCIRWEYDNPDSAQIGARLLSSMYPQCYVDIWHDFARIYTYYNEDII